MTVYVPNVKRDKKRIIHKTNGIPIAVINFDIITIDGENKVCRKIRGFYEKLFERFSKWVNEDFEAYAKKCYEEDSTPRKRYRYNAVELKYEMEYEIADERFLIVDTVIRLFKENNEISKKKLKHIWDLRNGILHTKRAFFEKEDKKTPKNEK